MDKSSQTILPTSSEIRLPGSVPSMVARQITGRYTPLAPNPGKGAPWRIGEQEMSPTDWRRALTADRATFEAIHILASGGELERATAMADEALARGIEHPLLLNLSALKLEDDGRLEEALQRLRRAVEIAPRDVPALNALGLCYSRLEQPERALGQFDALLAIDPGFAPAHANRAAVMEALGRLEEARLGHVRALELQPANLVALAGLASIHSRRGQHQEARQLAQAVLRLEPRYPGASMSLAAAELAEGDAAAAERLMRELLDDPRPSPLERAQAMSLLGDALDEQRRTSEAFQAYCAGNLQKQKLYAGRFGNGPTTTDFVRRTVTVLDGLERRAQSAVGHASAVSGTAKEHVFLLGFPRSGTTLLEQVLASHTSVETLEERESLIDAAREFMRRPSDLAALCSASEHQLHQHRNIYWQHVLAAGAQIAGKVFVDKHPLNTLKLPLIARLFPHAKILFAVRDPRDVVLSCFRRRFRMNAPMYEFLTLPTAAALYDAAMQLAVCVGRTWPMRSHLVRHEVLVGDFEGEVRAICAFVGLDWADTMREFAARVQERSIATPSGAQLAGGLKTTGIGHWQHYRQQMENVMPLLLPWVEFFGYSPNLPPDEPSGAVV